MATMRPPLRLIATIVLLSAAGITFWRVLARLSVERGAAAPATAATAAIPAPQASPTRFALREIVRGLRHPLFVTHAGDGSGRLWIVEQGGMVRLLRDGRLLERPFLDVTARLDNSSGERGLLGLAFAPDVARSRRFFISHTAPGPVVRVVRYGISTDPDRADPASARTVLEMDDPAANHNGGMLAFGPDGYLWIGTGDGGSAGDPWDNARDLGSLLGKMLRVDVRGDGYSIPPDNPYAPPRRGPRPEIWALGLRNPWRYSFDRTTGELWIGDVGQNAWEEIDVESPRERGGRHYGWKTMEGFACYSPRRDCDASGLTPPIHAYGRDQGCSVTGGYVYRGTAIPQLVGTYLFGDYCSGRIWGLVREPSGRARVELLLESGLSISSFGEDEAGELYLCDHLGGRVLRLVPAPGA